MEIFNEKNYMKGQFAVNSKGDIIIEYSIEGSRLFYGIKKNGKGFFNGEYIKKLQLNNKVRYESENIFISLNNNNDNNIEYLLNFGANDTAVELFNFEENIDQNYIIKTPNEVLGNSIFSYVNSLIELNNNNIKEYLLIYIYDQNYFLKKLSFSSFNLDNIVIKEVQTSSSTTNVNENRMVNGIVFNENYILVLFISGDKYFCNIFDFELNLKSDFALDIIEKFEDGFGLFAKAINLQENYIAFFYYIKEGKLKFQLGQIENVNNMLNPSLNFNISQGNFLSDPRLNEVIKLNSQRCAFFAFREKHNLNNDNNFGEVSDSLTILLFDLYNDYQNLKIREYKIELEKYKYHREISATIYNGFICFSSSVYQSSPLNNIISIFMMFGYFNQTNQENNKTIDIYGYFSNESNDKNIVDDILNNIEIIIENNIFGYIFLKDCIRLVSIPSEIEFYNNEEKLKNEDVLYRDYILKENNNVYFKTGNYSFEYQIIVTEPEYEVFDSYPINISHYSSSDNEPAQREFFEPQKFYGKITSINFMLYSRVDLCSYEKLLNSDCNIQKNNNSEVYKKLTNNIIQSYPEKGDSVTIETGNNYIYQITTMDNEISSLNGTIDNPKNLSIIDLGDCEELLRGENNITDNQNLIFLKYEKLTEVVSDKSIQYEVYHPTTKQKLDLSICDTSTISIYIPINLPDETKQKYIQLDKQGYDLFNPNDSFYNDLCTPFKSEDGTDVPMNDRRNDYFQKYNNNTQCQANCQYDDYLSDLGYLKCECGVSNEDIETEHFDKFKNKVIYESFYDILKNSNYKVVKCYNLIFNKKIFLKNYGSMLVLAYFAIFAVFLIYYIIVGINPLKINTMKTINENQLKEKRKTVLLENVGIDINNNANKRQSKFKYKRIKKQSLNPPKKNSTKFINTKNEEKRDTFSNNDISIKIKTNSNFIRNKKINNHQKAKYKSIILFNKELNIINNNNNNYPNNKNKKNINETVNSPSIQSLKSPMINPKKMKFSLSQKNIINDIKELNEIKEENKKLDDYELNNLEYLEAIELDKRNILDVYWSTLKREHIILFTFFIRNDYNLVSIKFSRFIFLVCTDMAMNVFFFTDDSMHKVYKNYGKYDFVQQIPQIIYSTIVSQVLEVFLCFLSLTDKHVYQMKEIKNVQNNMNLIFRILRCVKIKLIGFYAFTLILFAFYWYLVSSFCAVYQNTQIIFIKDSISSFLLGLLYPFVLYIFPAILRVLSLKDREKKRFKVIFIISDIIPIF